MPSRRRRIRFRSARTARAQRSNVTVSFNDIIWQRPNTITVTDAATGAAVDPYRLDSYALQSASDGTQRTTDIKRTAFVEIERPFSWRVPVTIKSGLDLRHQINDGRGTSLSSSYVGADGRTSTTPVTGDDQAAPFLDPGASSRSDPMVFPAGSD